MLRVACKKDNSANVDFQIMSPDPYFTSFLFLERNSAIIRNILMVFGRIIDPVSVENHMQK